MPRQAAAIALIAGFLAAPRAFADDARPDTAHLRAAAAAFDAGVGALKQKDFEAAATHFEAADAAVPSPKALRQAIKARSEASQGAQAATLAALALERYAGDEVLAKLARDTVEKFEPLLYKVRVSCAAPCLLSVGTQRVPGAPGTRRVLFLDPGPATVHATFPNRDGAVTEGAVEAKVDAKVDARAGDGGDLHLEPKKKAPPPHPPEPEKASTNEVPPDDPRPEPPPPERRGISPVFFGVSLAATVGMGVTTIWSGVDTQNNPGAAAVISGCKGQGTSCPLYQEGVSKQNRTNALIGTTAGAAALTIVLAVFTNWRGSGKPPATPTALIVDRGAVLGAAGAF